MLYQQSFRLDYQREVLRVRRRSSTDQRKPASSPPPPPPDSIMKGILIFTLCAVYTVVLFSCVAAIKTLAILVMGQPLSLKALDFKKEKSEEKYDQNFNSFLKGDSVSRFIMSGDN